MKPIWIIEGRDKGDDEWYSCWYEVFYSAKEGRDKLRELKDGNNGFHLPSKYRVVEYMRKK